MTAGIEPGTTRELDFKHPVSTLLAVSQNTQLGVQMHVGLVFQMKWRGGGWYSSDADTVTGCEPGWIHPAGSSEALSLGFIALKQREI